MSLEKLSYTVKEARQVTGAGTTTIMQALRRGDLQSVRVGITGQGRRYLISAESLKSWVTPQAGK
jgi:excisionase family DNA binding protein